MTGIAASTQINTAYASSLSFKPQTGNDQFKPQAVAFVDTGSGAGSSKQGELSSLVELRAFMKKAFDAKPISYREYMRYSKAPARFNPAGVYVRFGSGSHKGEVADFSTVKNIMSYMSSADKVYLMDYGFREMGLQQMHMRDANGRNLTTVTLAEFRKINGAYEDALKETGGGNSGAVQRALKNLNALGEKLYPAGKMKVPSSSQQKKRMGGSQDGVQPTPSLSRLPSNSKSGKVTFKRKDKSVPYCKMTINLHEYQNFKEGKYAIFGIVLDEPEAKHSMFMDVTIESNYSRGVFVQGKIIGGTDGKPFDEATGFRHAKIEINTEIQISPSEFTPTVLKLQGRTFQQKLTETLNLQPHAIGACSDGLEWHAPSQQIFRETKYINGVRVK